MTHPSLLPPNATPFMRAMEAAPAFAPTFAPIETMVGAKFDPPDSWLPCLLYEYGLGELLPYLDDPRRAIREGVLWQRARGTAAALKTAFGWRGFGAQIEEAGPGPRYYWFQVDPGKIALGAESADLAGLAGLSAPARARLIRLYHGLDRRSFRLSKSALSGLDLLSGWSGVWDPTLQVWLSYGMRAAAAAEHDGAEAAASFKAGVSVAVHAPARGFRLSQSALSGYRHFWPAEAGGAMAVTLGNLPTGIDFAGGQVGLRSRPRSHVGLSCTRFGEIHHRFGGYTVESSPFRLSQFGLSRARSAIIRHPIRSVATVNAVADAKMTADPLPLTGGRLTAVAATPLARGRFPRLSHFPPVAASAGAIAGVRPVAAAATYTDALWSDALWSDLPWPINPVTVGTAWLS